MTCLGEIGNSDISDLAGANQGIQGLQSLLERRLTVPFVKLIEIDVLGA
jgi:hypothetical protein